MKTFLLFVSSYFVALLLMLGANNCKAQDINKAFEYYKLNKFEQAAPEFEKALPIVAKDYGGNSTAYRRSLFLTAVSFDKISQYQKAITYYKQCMDAYKLANETSDVAYSVSHNNIGALYLTLGKYTLAENFFKKAVEQNIKQYGKQNIQYAQSLNNMAVLYETMGWHQKAEPLFLEVRKIFEKQLGTQHESYAINSNNLGALYLEIGELEKGKRHITKAKDFYKTKKNTAEYATSCLNLGRYYFFKGESTDSISEKNDFFQKSEYLQIEAKNIRKQVFGTYHPDYGQCCNNLGALYRRMGYWSKAEEFYLIAKTIYKKTVGEQHMEYVTACNNLGEVYLQMKKYEKAEPLLLFSLKSTEKQLGKYSSFYIITCRNLADLYEKVNNKTKAEQYYTELNKLLTGNILRQTKLLSTSQKAKFMEERAYFIFDMISSFSLKRSDSKKLVGDIYNNALYTKGLLLRSDIAIRKQILNSKKPELINNFKKMNEIGNILANQYSLPINTRIPNIKQLEEEAYSIEKYLLQNSDFYLEKKLTGTDWRKIQQSLKEDEAAIEFINFRYHNKEKWSGEKFYYALLISKNTQSPVAVYLCEEKELKNLLQRKENQIDFDYIKDLYDLGSTKADSLYQLVWKPIEKHLDVVKTICISPSGLLNTISFDAIPCSDTSLLSDKYKIIYTNSTASIINSKALTTNQIKSIALFGGIDYDLDISLMKLQNKIADQSLSDKTRNSLSEIIAGQNRSLNWSYLHGTLTEVNDIKLTLENSNISIDLYKEDKATEEQFKILEKNAPSILHVSTHGFYFGSDKKSIEYKNMIDDNIKFAHSEDPLIRSGLVFAGGNNKFQGIKLPENIEDGILTAAEISKMNLFKTKLAVLSACQTGLGEIDSDGVYGLQRGFKMAGVDYLLYSLWEVPDYQTKELMVKFYGNWINGMEIRDAFKKAQEHMKNKYAKVKGAAYGWAAFVLKR